MSNTISAKAIQALENGNKIEAIKIIKSETSHNLKQCKHLVNTYISENSILKEKYESIQSKGLSQEAILKLVVFMLVLGGVFIYLTIKS